MCNFNLRSRVAILEPAADITESLIRNGTEVMMRSRLQSFVSIIVK